MTEIFDALVPIAVGVVFVVLLIGIVVMFRGGEVNRTWSNRLMRLRVVMQFVAICVIMSAIYFAGNS